MNKIRSFILGSCLLALIPLTSSAAQYTGTIIRMTNEWGGGAFIVELNGVLSPCSAGGYYIQQSATTSYKEMVSTAILAFSLGKTVNLTTDAAQTCVNGRVVLVAVQINN